MAIVVKDRVKVTFATTGTADFTLGAAVVGFQSFAAIGNNNFTYYSAYDPNTGAWEVGYGQYTTAGPTLTRNTVLSSSAAGAKVSFGAGTKEVFCAYPSEKAIYEEFSGNVLIDGGPITVIGSGVSPGGYTTFSAALGEMYADVDSFAQFYAQNLNDGAEASADFVAYNDLGDGVNNFVDVGINSSNYSSATYPIFTPGSAYLFNDGGELFVGSATDDVVLFAGGVDTTDEAVRIDKTTKAVTTVGAVNVGGALDVTGAVDITGAATFGSTVTLNANPTLALQAATKAYVDNQVTAGLHIHEPVRVETTINLTATYVQGGTTFNITDITGTNTVTTSVNHGLSVNDQIWLYSTAGNGLSTNTAYFVYSTPALNTLTLSLTFGGAQITGLTNASGLTYATRANSGVGATLTNAGTQVALTVDGVALSVADRVMVRLQTTGAENGVYTVTTVGSGSTNWVLTRATDANMVNPANPNGLGTGDYFFTQEGLLNAGDSHVLTTEPNTMIIGYTTLTYTQFSGGIDYTGGTNIDVTGQVISLTGTVAATNGGTGINTVAVGDLLYGSAANTWSKLPIGAAYKTLSVNGAGTQVEWNAVALNESGAVSGTLPATSGGTNQNAYAVGDTLYSGATNTLSKLAGNTTTTKKFLGQTGTGAASAAPVWEQPAASDITGLAASATTDTTNASNITSGTLGTSRLSGSYTGVTGVGTLTAGTWNATTIAADYGGTGFASYAVGDILYADTTTTLAKLPDVAVGNALISGGVAAAPSWGKIGLATHVSGTLPAGSGGTGLTSPGTAGNVLTSNGTVWVSQAPTASVTPVIAPYYYFSGTVSATTGSYTASTVGLVTGTTLTATGAGTATSSGTTLTVSAVSAGAFGVGQTVTFPAAFTGTATSSGTTLTIATATAGVVGVGTVLNTNASFTASRAGTTMTVTAVASGGIHVGMVVSTLGTVNSFGTGTGGTGTYVMSASGTVASGARTGTGTATITALGTGTGGVGTYTTNRTFTYATASAVTYNSGAAPTRTITAMGTGIGGAGTYTLDTVITAATAVAITGSALTYTVTSGAYNSTTGTLTPAYTIASVATTTGSNTWTIPAGVTSCKVTIVGGGGGSGGAGNLGCDNGYSGGGGGGGAAVEILSGLTPGNTLSITVGAGGAGGAAGINNGSSGGTSSVASGTQIISTVSATGGAGSPGTGTSDSASGAGGAGSGGDINFTGQKGGVGRAGSYEYSGVGGSSFLAPTQLFASYVGVAGAQYGGGATGVNKVAGAIAGQRGAAGIVIVEY